MNIYPVEVFPLSNIKYKKTNSRNSLKQNTVTFNGHLGAEKYAHNSIKYLISETALFRDIQTKYFVKDYILKNFSHKDKIKMLIGGCSTGEEAYTYSMLLNSLKEKIVITGFDLSEKSIKAANSRELTMYNPKHNSNSYLDTFTKSFQDSFLCFDLNKNLTPEQAEQKKLFDEFFEITSLNVPQKNESFMLKFKKWYLKKVFKFSLPEYDSKIVKLKDNQADNCSFVQGDILDIDKITNGEKADIITFSNAMYHMITENVFNGLLRKLTPDAADTVKKIGLNAKANLNSKGLFVLGENEVMQTMDFELVPDIFKELGFTPLNEKNNNLFNIWQLL